MIFFRLRVALLVSSLQLFSYFVHILQQLCLAGSSALEAVLFWTEDVLPLKVRHDVADDDVFHQLAGYTDQ